MNKDVIKDSDIANAIQQIERDKEAIQVLQSVSRTDLENLFENEKKKNRAKSTIRRIIYASVSAAAIVAVVITLNLFRDKTGENLYLAYFEAPTNETIASRGISSDLSLEIEKFYDLYANKEYAEGLQFATSIFKNNELTENPELLFYISICQLEMNKTSDAEKNLIQLSELGDSFSYSQSVNWYLALAYLKNNKINEAKTILEKIMQEGLYYSDKANELLSQLN